ncbi:unnamed protein product [Strongylus vulgaris]|uniref:Uncharacterized protein n=1 Tax=Strongylus vulgaris TaxID=40348 RepID=A0A3P7I8K7_STRVU|nr:unnamed protein product [Strongylus vulgaris]
MIQRSTIIILLAASVSAFDFTDIQKEYGIRRTVQVYTKIIAALKAKSTKHGDGLEKINTMVKTKIGLGPEEDRTWT